MAKKIHYIKALVDKVEEDGVLEVSIASSSNLDRDGEIILQNWKLDNFKKSPVLLWSHNPYIPAIGSVLEIEVVNNKLLFKPKFDMDDEFAKLIYGKYKKGILTSFSVGFMAQRSQNIYEEPELLEISTVAIPANPDARVMREMSDVYEYAESKGFKLETEAKKLMDQYHLNKKSNYDEKLSEMDERLKALESRTNNNEFPQGDKGHSNPTARKYQNRDLKLSPDLRGALIQVDKAVGLLLHKAKKQKVVN